MSWAEIERLRRRERIVTLVAPFVGLLIGFVLRGWLT